MRVCSQQLGTLVSRREPAPVFGGGKTLPERYHLVTVKGSQYRSPALDAIKRVTRATYALPHHRIMVSSWVFLTVATCKVALASTTLCRENATLTVREMSSQTSIHKITQASHIWESNVTSVAKTPASLNYTSSTASRLLQLPWMGNVSRIAGPTYTDVPSIDPKPTITVGKGRELKFAPATLDVAPGSVVVFNFLGLNHTLTESELADPCRSNGGFDTGFAQFNPTNISGQFFGGVQNRRCESQVVFLCPKYQASPLSSWYGVQPEPG
jgi:plastocyanin